VKFTRQRYQLGSLSRERRKAGSDVWIFRWREETSEGRANRKVVIGTVEQFPTKSAARRAAEPFRAKAIAENPAVPVAMMQLVKHYTTNELAKQGALNTANRGDSTGDLDQSSMGRIQTRRGSNGGG
jgi:integrase